MFQEARHRNAQDAIARAGGALQYAIAGEVLY